MNEAHSQLYAELKKAYRKAIKIITENTNLKDNVPMVIVDLHCSEVHFFTNESDAQEYVSDKYTVGWEVAPDGTDEKLITIKFFTEKELPKNSSVFGEVKCIKKGSEMNIFRVKSFVDFEIEEFHLNRGLEIAIHVVI